MDSDTIPPKRIMTGCVILASGGIDSTVLAAMAKKQEVKALLFVVDYGQRSAHQERVSVACVAEHYGFDTHCCEIDSSPFQRSILIGKFHDPITPDFGGDSVELASRDNNPLDVPFRNGVLISLAVAEAVTRDYDSVWIGTHRSGLEKKGLAPFYPDCSPGFILSMRAAISIATRGKVKLETPLQSFYKEDVIRYGTDLDVPWGLTYSCYVGHSTPCGRCLQCQDRSKYFAHAMDDEVRPKRG